MTLLQAKALSINDDRTALIFISSDQPDQQISRATFRQETARYAAGLSALGVQAGQLVLIADTHSLEAIYTFWGALWLGAIPTLFPTKTEKLDPLVYQQRMEKLIELSAVQMVVTNPTFALEWRDNSTITCPIHTTAELKTTHPAVPPHQADPNEIAFLQHSSGTTGLQKGVALTHAAVQQQLDDYSLAISLHEGDIVTSWLPLYHDMGLIAGFLLPLVQGIPLVIMSPFTWARTPAILLQAISRYQGTLCWLPNFAYNHCARRIRLSQIEGVSLESVRLIINCSEPVRHDSHQLFLQKFGRYGLQPEALGVSYAMAENTFAVTQTEPNQAIVLDLINGRILAEKSIAQPAESEHPDTINQLSCGRPLAQTAVQILDSHGQELPDRHVGEITIKSPYMLQSYYRRPDLHPFDDAGWYHTGDMGYTVAGELFVIGRQKDLIINAGKNIYPQDIEVILNTIKGVHPGRVVVFGVPDKKEGTELLAALVESSLEDEQELRELSRRLRQAVAQQSMVTLSYAQVVPPKWLIKTSSGKIGRAANRDKWLKERSSG